MNWSILNVGTTVPRASATSEQRIWDMPGHARRHQDDLSTETSGVGTAGLVSSKDVNRMLLTPRRRPGIVCKQGGHLRGPSTGTLIHVETLSRWWQKMPRNPCSDRYLGRQVHAGGRQRPSSAPRIDDHSSFKCTEIGRKQMFTGRAIRDESRL